MNILLVVDLQKEFKDKDGQYDNILQIVKHAYINGYDAVYATVTVNTKDSAYVRYGRWDDCMGMVEPLEFRCDKMIIKHGFGLDDYSILDKSDTYTIIGFNTDACVLKVATDLFDRNYNFKVLLDLCYSSNGKEKHERGVELFKDLMPDALG